MAHYALIVEDHPLYREGLGEALGLFLTDTVILKASSAEEGILLTDHLKGVRLICLDLGLPKLHDIEAVSVFRNKFPDSLIVIVSGNENASDRALAGGADAFIPKSASTGEIARVLHQAISGRWYYSQLDSFVNGLNAEAIPPTRLTPRQMEVIELLEMGLSNKQIAKQLDLAEVTVKLHVSGIFRVLGVNCRSKALLIARKSGLLKSA